MRFANFHKHLQEAFEQLRKDLDSPEALVRKAETLQEDQSKGHFNCINCKNFDWRPACIKHRFRMTIEESQNHACKDFIYDSDGIFD